MQYCQTTAMQYVITVAPLFPSPLFSLVVFTLFSSRDLQRRDYPDILNLSLKYGILMIVLYYLISSV
jgi:hypothetical protein